MRSKSRPPLHMGHELPRQRKLCLFRWYGAKSCYHAHLRCLPRVSSTGQVPHGKHKSVRHQNCVRPQTLERWQNLHTEIRPMGLRIHRRYSNRSSGITCNIHSPAWLGVIPIPHIPHLGRYDDKRELQMGRVEG